MACPRIAVAVSFDFSPLNVRIFAPEKVAGGNSSFLPLAVSRINSNSSSNPVLNLDFDFEITGGVSWRQIS